MSLPPGCSVESGVVPFGCRSDRFRQRDGPDAGAGPVSFVRCGGNDARARGGFEAVREWGRLAGCADLSDGDLNYARRLRIFGKIFCHCGNPDRLDVHMPGVVEWHKMANARGTLVPCEIAGRQNALLWQIAEVLQDCEVTINIGIVRRP